MREYYKLAVFIAVLLLSLSMMSAAINFLGDISDVDLDMEQKAERTESSADNLDTSKGSVKTMKVEGAPAGGPGPLFEIMDPPQTRYIRYKVGEVYNEGGWTQSEKHVSVSYRGGSLELETSLNEPFLPVSFFIRPFFNLTGFIPCVKSTISIDFDGKLEHYPFLELFSSPEPFDFSYGVTYAKYDFSEASLIDAKVSVYEDYLIMPEELKSRFRNLALQIVEGKVTPYEKLRAIESYLKETYEYNEEYLPAPPGVDPVERFLFEEMNGICSHFNSAFVLLARSIGISPRIVNGFIVSPDSEYQLVMPDNAHLWAEVHFEKIGWITFDATPESFEERPQEIEPIPTLTNITYNDATALKGGYFIVSGTVTTYNGSAVDGLSVEIFLTVHKNETGVRCGLGLVHNGVFDINCSAYPSLEVGDFDLLAHSMSNGVYQESWSDPPIRIMTETEVSIQAPVDGYTESDIKIVGNLIDKSNGEPIANTNIMMVVENNTYQLSTDDKGAVHLTHSYQTEGNKTVYIYMQNTDYFVGSNSSFGISISIPPTRQPGLLEIITMFPYNIVIATILSISLGAVILLTRKRKLPVTKHLVKETRIEPIIEEEFPPRFKSHKEGIVKLFNYLFAHSRRKFDNISGSMTPREFQYAFMQKIPESASKALDYLVTAFEIADYSTANPPKEVYDKCLSAVELLKGLIVNE